MAGYFIIFIEESFCSGYNFMKTGRSPSHNKSSRKKSPKENIPTEKILPEKKPLS